MLTHPDGTREPLVVGLPGDREVDAKRLGAQLEPAEAEPFTEQDFAQHPALVKGYIGPAVLGSTARAASATWSTRGWWTARVGDRRQRRGPARASTW